MMEVECLGWEGGREGGEKLDWRRETVHVVDFSCPERRLAAGGRPSPEDCDRVQPRNLC